MDLQSETPATARPDGVNRLIEWLVLDVNRLALTAVLAAAIFGVVVGSVSVLDPPFTEQIEAEDTIETLFSTMLTVIVTGTTLVVTIGQLVLTQEDGPLGDQHERMAASMAVRDAVATEIGAPSPADPADFLSALLETASRRAADLRASAGDSDGALADEVEALADDVVADAGAVRERLDGARFGSFAVVRAALAFDYSATLARIERLEDEFAAELTPADGRRLEAMRAPLELYSPAREHIKTLYFQWALIDLSQSILAAAVPALAVAGVMVAVVDAGTFPGTTLGVETVVLVVGAAFAVTLVPFLLFVAVLVRILTVAKRTLAIEPLCLRD